MKGRKKIVKEYTIRTGDGQILQVDRAIGQVSDKLEKLFLESDEVYLENCSESSVQLVINFYEAYSKFTMKQKKRWEEPMQLVEKIGKAAQSESDKKLVTVMYIYKKLQAKEFFELMKTAMDMELLPLVRMLAFITTSRILNKDAKQIEEMFILSAKNEKWNVTK